MQKIKYLAAFILPVTILLAFYLKNAWVWLPLGYVFGFVPFLELFLKPDHKNLSEAEEAIAKKDAFYDVLTYTMLPVLYGLVLLFLWQINSPALSSTERAGLIVALGLGLGVLGINVAHELGHRVNAHEQNIAKLLLLPALYTHFFIEHNRGHHKHVATSHDPASATKGENLYAFWVRSTLGSYLSAWHIEANQLKKAGKSFWSWHNEMLRFTVAQASFLGAIAYFCGAQTLLYYLPAAAIGFLLLETVNYIEHYGLSRKATTETSYERVQPHHSWNSNHVVGRLVLFELSRHSDHHYKASRTYQVLQNHPNTPQMPTGYPGMMLLALLPPVWFWVMDKKV